MLPAQRIPFWRINETRNYFIVNPFQLLPATKVFAQKPVSNTSSWFLRSPKYDELIDKRQ